MECTSNLKNAITTNDNATTNDNVHTKNKRGVYGYSHVAFTATATATGVGARAVELSD